MRKPNAIIHMALWGTAGGIATALLYLFLLLLMLNASFEAPGIFVLASLYGGVPGAVLGVIDGLIIRSVLNSAEIDDLYYVRKKSQARIGLVTFFGMLFFMGIAISPMLFIYIYVSFVPPILAMVMAVYACKRYFMRVAALNGLKAKLRSEESDGARIERLSTRPMERGGSVSGNYAKAGARQQRYP